MAFIYLIVLLSFCQVLFIYQTGLAMYPLHRHSYVAVAGLYILGSFFDLGPTYRAKKEANWPPFEAKDKIIGPVRSYPNSQMVARLPPSGERQEEDS